MNQDQIFLVTHVGLKNRRGQLCIDDQTAAGLVRWGENFEHVVYAGIEDAAEANTSSSHWVTIKDLPCADRLEIVTMPNAYKVSHFLSNYRPVRAKLARQIARSKYLCFTLGALTGDWAAVAGVEAIRQRRRYAVWFDRVEHEVIRSHLPTMPFKRRVKETLSLPLMRKYHRYLVQRSQLGLFQGKDCYNYFSQFTDNGFCVYDTHTKPEDMVSPVDIEQKIRGLMSGEPLRICYVGRATEMKGPLDWIGVLERLRDAGVAFKASWIGDGPLLEKMRSVVAERNLSKHIELPGFSSDRAEIFSTMRRAHIFMFCHKTPESPRCLIESLVCGTPIIGYESAYARVLVDDGGGAFVNVGDIAALSERVTLLDRSRGALAAMMQAAAQDGRRFDEETLYRQRALLIREKL